MQSPHIVLVWSKVDPNEVLRRGCMTFSHQIFELPSVLIHELHDHNSSNSPGGTDSIHAHKARWCFRVLGLYQGGAPHIGHQVT